jgi:hypothetical protein
VFAILCRQGNKAGILKKCAADSFKKIFNDQNNGFSTTILKTAKSIWI